MRDSPGKRGVGDVPRTDAGAVSPGRNGVTPGGNSPGRNGVSPPAWNSSTRNGVSPAWDSPGANGVSSGGNSQGKNGVSSGGKSLGKNGVTPERKGGCDSSVMSGGGWGVCEASPFQDATLGPHTPPGDVTPGDPRESSRSQDKMREPSRSRDTTRGSAYEDTDVSSFRKSVPPGDPRDPREASRFRDSRDATPGDPREPSRSRDTTRGSTYEGTNTRDVSSHNTSRESVSTPVISSRESVISSGTSFRETPLPCNSATSSRTGLPQP